jgi:hypothetical protein
MKLIMRNRSVRRKVLISRAMKDGLIAGFGAPALFFDPQPPLKAYRVSVEDAWRTVGDHISAALEKESGVGETGAAATSKAAGRT